MFVDDIWSNSIGAPLSDRLDVGVYFKTLYKYCTTLDLAYFITYRNTKEKKVNDLLDL